VNLNVNSVRFHNFFSFGNVWQEVVLQPGINLVQGNVVEKGTSNGSGKCVKGSTTIFVDASKEIMKLLTEL